MIQATAFASSGIKSRAPKTAEFDSRLGMYTQSREDGYGEGWWVYVRTPKPGTARYIVSGRPLGNMYQVISHHSHGYKGYHIGRLWIIVVMEEGGEGGESLTHDDE